MQRRKIITRNKEKLHTQVYTEVNPFVVVHNQSRLISNWPNYGSTRNAADNFNFLQFRLRHLCDELVGKIMTLCPGNPSARTHWAFRCSTCCLFSLAHHVRRSLVAYREIIAMSKYHRLSRSCIIRSTMPFSDVEDFVFLQLFQDGEESINN